MTNLYQYQNQLAQERFALQVAARLSDAVEALPYDISERLRAARVRALIARKVGLAQSASGIAVSGGAASLMTGGGDLNWWGRLASLVPLVALVFGLIVINMIQNDNRADELAEIDSALLTDDLPPSAYADPGFLQFLKLSAGQNQ